MALSPLSNMSGDLQTVVNALQQMTVKIGDLIKQIATSIPFLPTAGLVNAANDAAAAAAGVPLNGIYRNGSVLMVRVTLDGCILQPGSQAQSRSAACCEGRPRWAGIGFKSAVTSPKPSMRMPGLRRAFGGGIPDHPETPVIGAINTDTPGRTDAHPTHVPPGSYVMPADIVSAIGEGNTAAGQQMLAKMFLPMQAQSAQQMTLMAQKAPYGGTGGPYGAQINPLRTRPMKPPRAPPPYMPTPTKLPSFGQEAQGGAVPGEPQRPGTPINISGGEFVIPPQAVQRTGRGDVSRGHEILDTWVNHLRAEHVKTLKKLPGPAK